MYSNYEKILRSFWGAEVIITKKNLGRKFMDQTQLYLAHERPLCLLSLNVIKSSRKPKTFIVFFNSRIKNIYKYI